MVMFSSLGKYMPGHSDGDGCVFPDPWHFAPRRRVNPPNPILTKYRDIPEGSREPWRTGFLNAAKHQRFAAWSGDEVEHAVRVLSRIGASHDVG